MDIALEVSAEEGELRKAREIAKNLIAGGMDVDTVARYTGLTVDDILRLK